MDFIWDPKKAKSNLNKHNVSLEEATTVFYGPLAKTALDPDHLDQEDRFILIGHRQKTNLLSVGHVYQESIETMKITSSRKAKKEKKDFEEL